ncbi:MAG: DUF2007 domain-containing protein [Bacteroidetes bacterium]|jgi:hypothetical protein|nr:DUF2007 domain-containing protein [Bacteroidota bacterium]
MLVTIATYTSIYEASLVKGMLENEGIPAFLKDELINQINPLYAIAIGGIKLLVDEQFKQQALQLIKETKKSGEMD